MLAKSKKIHLSEGFHPVAVAEDLCFKALMF